MKVCEICQLKKKVKRKNNKVKVFTRRRPYERIEICEYHLNEVLKVKPTATPEYIRFMYGIPNK